MKYQGKMLNDKYGFKEGLGSPISPCLGNNIWESQPGHSCG